MDQMHQHRDGIKTSLLEAKVGIRDHGLSRCVAPPVGSVCKLITASLLQSYLDKLQEDIGKTLEKVGSREKYINNQLGHLIQEYRSAQAKLSEVTAACQSAAVVCFLISALTCALCQAKERHQQASGGVMDRTRVLAEVSEQREHEVTCVMTKPVGLSCLTCDLTEDRHPLIN